MKGMTNSIAPGNASIPRSALASDALYSPVKGISGTYSIVPDDNGKTLRSLWSTETTITLTAAVNNAMPIGSEIAFIVNGGGCTVTVSSPDAIRWLLPGSVQSNVGKKIRCETVYETFAIKKIGTDNWLVVGNVEVVS